MSQAWEGRGKRIREGDTESGARGLRRLLVCIAGVLLALWLGVATAFWTRALLLTEERLHGSVEGSRGSTADLEVQVEVGSAGPR